MKGTNMKKRIISLFLAVLMVVPMLVSVIFADAGAKPTAVSSTDENIATEAEISVVKKNATGELENVKVPSKVRLNKLVDGDKSKGTHAPMQREYAYVFEFPQAYYLSQVVVNCNGSGTLADATPVPAVLYNIPEMTMVAYNGEKIVYEETANGERYYRDVSETQEVVFEFVQPVTRVEVWVNDQVSPQSELMNNYMWEVELFGNKDMEVCVVEKYNIAKDATFSAYGIPEKDDNGNYVIDEETGEIKRGFIDVWWAVNWTTLTDGKKDVGTHSPKGWNYYISMDYNRDYLFSELVFTFNGKGYLNDGSGINIEEVKFNNTQIRVRLYNLDGVMVYDSKDVIIDGLEAKIDPFVEACKIEIEMANGKGTGDEYLWEIEAFIEDGEHLFEQTNAKNPTCDTPGYKEFSCRCGKVIKENIDATGFHQWDDGEVTKAPTATENGIRTQRCTICKTTTREIDEPATGCHWNSGNVIPPTCDEEGYTEYSCTDAGCSNTYKKDIKSATGHDWDLGKTVQKQALGVQGKREFTCMTCGEKETRSTRALTYTDNVTSFDFSNYKGITPVYNTEDKDYIPNDVAESYQKLDATADDLFDGDMSTYWFGTTGTTITLNLDREYVFTNGKLYVSGNSNVHANIQFINANGEVTGQFTNGWGAISNGADVYNPIELDMSGAVAGGAVANKIIIKVDAAKWPNGYAFTWHELQLTAHDCVVTEENYVMSGSDYNAPTCTQDGSTIAVCPVCSHKIPVTLPSEKFGHTVPKENIVYDTKPTCSTDGVGHGTCTVCGDTVNNIAVPATGVHDYSIDHVFLEEKCGYLGISQKVCACGKVGSQAPIPQTNNHTPEWVTEYAPTYTADGKDKYICTGCGRKDVDNRDTVDGKANERKGKSEFITDKKTVTKELVKFKGYGLRLTDFAGIRLNYQLNIENNKELLNLLEYECDIRIITYVTNSKGETKTVESYGKYSLNNYDVTTGDFSVVIKPESLYEEYEIRTVVRLMNFRGVEIIECPMTKLEGDSNGKISFCEIAQSMLNSSSVTEATIKNYLEEVVKNKPKK